jgi:hypothetical protein
MSTLPVTAGPPSKRRFKAKFPGKQSRSKTMLTGDARNFSGHSVRSSSAQAAIFQPGFERNLVRS